MTEPRAASMPNCLLSAGSPPSLHLDNTIRSSAGTDTCTPASATTMISSTGYVWSSTDCPHARGIAALIVATLHSRSDS